MRTLAMLCVVAAVTAAPASAAAPANDNRAAATVLAPAGGTLTQTTDEATKEPGEADHAGDGGGASVWFTWAPNFTGVAVVDTTGSDFDTLLDVRDVSGAVIGSNDDVSDAGGRSTVCFGVTNGTPVTIAADGYTGASGSLTLNWSAWTGTSACPMMPPALGGNVAAPKVGDTLTATLGTWTRDGTPSGRWLRCIEYQCVRAGDDGTSTYVVQRRDVGTALRFDATMTVDDDSTSNASDPSGIVGQPAETHANGRIFWSTNRDSVPGQGSLNLELYSMFGDGTGLLRVTNRDGLDSEVSATSDGEAIVYAQDSTLVVADADGGDPFDLELAGRFPVWSPDNGSRIAYVSSDPGASGIRVFDGLNDHWVIPLAPDSVREVAWSPDGTRIAFSYRPPGADNFDIAVVRADGRGAITFLTTSPIDDHSPAWSPDASRIAFVRGPVAGQVDDGDLYVMDADGTHQTLYVDGEQSAPDSALVNSVAWSRTGRSSSTART